MTMAAFAAELTPTTDLVRARLPSAHILVGGGGIKAPVSDEAATIFRSVQELQAAI